MSRSDDLKNRLDELFSVLPAVEIEAPVRVGPETTAIPHEEMVKAQPAITGKQSVHPLITQAFQGAFENVAVGMVLTSLDGRLLRVNEAFGQMLGYTQAELEGVSFQSLTHAEDQKVGGEAMRAMLSGAAGTARIEKRYLRKDGQVVWVELNVTLMRDADGKPAFFSTVALDVSRQHEMASMLEKRVQELNCLNDIGHMVDNHPELDQLFVWLAERIPAAFQHPELCIAAVEYRGQVYGNEEAVKLSSKTVHGLRVGEELVGWLHVAYTEPRHFVDSESALMGAIASRVNGYLENVQQQNELGRRADLMVTIMDATPDWIFVKDREHRFIIVNQSFATALGRNKDDFIGKNDLEMGFPEKAVMGDPEQGIQGYWWDDERVLSTGEEQTILGEKNFLDGKVHYFDVFKTAMRDVHGRIIGLMGYARDVTDREQLLNEVQLRAQSLRMFQNGLENSTDAVFMTDTQGVITYVNPGFEKTYGFSRDAAIGQTPRIIKSGFIPQEGYQQFWENLLNGVIVSGEIVNKTKDGRIIPVEGSNIPIKDEEGKVIAFLAVHRDITERKQAAEKLARRAAQLATVAEISTAVTALLRPQELLQSVVDRTQESFGLYHAHIYLLDPAQRKLVLAAGASDVGRLMTSQGWHIPLDREQSLVTQAVRRRKAVVVNDVQADADFLPNALLPETKSEMAVPLIAGQDVLGVLDVQSDAVDRFEQEEIDIMTTLAAQVSVALQNARRYAEIQSAAQREHILREITDRVRSSSNAETILRTAVRELGDALGRKTFIRLVDDRETEKSMASAEISNHGGGNGSQSQVAGGEQ